jgi:hypothetical protein
LDAAFAHLTQGLDSSSNPSLQPLQLTGSTFTSTAIERLQALSLEVSEELDAYQQRHAR